MTATLYELMDRGLDKIYYEKDKHAGIEPNEHGIITFLDDPDYLNKIISYDDEVKLVINKIFSYTFANPTLDEYVKRTFLNRFVDRSIKWEFVPVSAFVWAPKVFTMKLAALCGEKDKYLSFLFDNFDKYMTNNTDSNTDEVATSDTETNYRSILATLPQDSFNVNVRDYVSPSADENKLDNTLTDNERKGNTHSSVDNFDPKILQEMSEILTRFFNECDQRLFKQVWGVRINEQNN